MIWTLEEVREWLPILQAFANGETIQRHNGVYTIIDNCIKPDPEGWSDCDNRYIDFGTGGLNHNFIKRPGDCYRLKPLPNPCIGCKYHYNSTDLFTGNNEWYCGYGVCKYNSQIANPKEGE